VPIVADATVSEPPPPPVIEAKLVGAVVQVPCGMDNARLTRVLRAHSSLGIPSMINIPSGARVLLATRPVDWCRPLRA
jgi:hypothetical protein